MKTDSWVKTGKVPKWLQEWLWSSLHSEMSHTMMMHAVHSHEFLAALRARLEYPVRQMAKKALRDQIASFSGAELRAMIRNNKRQSSRRRSK